MLLDVGKYLGEYSFWVLKGAFLSTASSFCPKGDGNLFPLPGRPRSVEVMPLTPMCAELGPLRVTASSQASNPFGTFMPISAKLRISLSMQ